MVVFLLLRQRERERERESSFFFGRKFRISFYFLICFINPNGVSPGNGGVMEELMDGVSLQKTLFLFGTLFFGTAVFGHVRGGDFLGRVGVPPMSFFFFFFFWSTYFFFKIWKL